MIRVTALLHKHVLVPAGMIIAHIFLSMAVLHAASRISFITVDRYEIWQSNALELCKIDYRMKYFASTFCCSVFWDVRACRTVTRQARHDCRIVFYRRTSWSYFISHTQALSNWRSPSQRTTQTRRPPSASSPRCSIPIVSSFVTTAWCKFLLQILCVLLLRRRNYVSFSV